MDRSSQDWQSSEDLSIVLRLWHCVTIFPSSCFGSLQNIEKKNSLNSCVFVYGDIPEKREKITLEEKGRCQKHMTRLEGKSLKNEIRPKYNFDLHSRNSGYCKIWECENKFKSTSIHIVERALMNKGAIIYQYSGGSLVSIGPGSYFYMFCVCFFESISIVFA